MSGKQAKKIRKEARKAVEKNKDLVLQSVITKIKAEKFTTRLAFCWLVLFGRGKWK